MPQQLGEAAQQEINKTPPKNPFAEPGHLPLRKRVDGQSGVGGCVYQHADAAFNSFGSLR